MDNKLSIYVAGAWIRREQLKETMKEIAARDESFEITSGWVDREIAGPRTPETQAMNGNADINEVSSSDVLVAIMNEHNYAYRGTFTEIGCALGLKKPIIIVCDGDATPDPFSGDMSYSHNCMQNVFYWCDDISHVRTVDEAIEKLKSILKNKITTSESHYEYDYADFIGGVYGLGMV